MIFKFLWGSTKDSSAMYLPCGGVSKLLHGCSLVICWVYKMRVSGGMSDQLTLLVMLSTTISHRPFAFYPPQTTAERTLPFVG